MSQRHPWRIRLAGKRDRGLLQNFKCADPTVKWGVEVEDFIHNQLLDWALDPRAKTNDPRLLLVFDRKTMDLVGLAAHEREFLRDGTGTQFAATKLEIVALATAWQGRLFASGERASDVVMSAAMTDVTSRVPKRHARVFAVVHENNARSIALCKRYGFTDELSRPNFEYRRLLTNHRH